MGADNKIGFIRQPAYHDLIALDFLQIDTEGKIEILDNYQFIHLKIEEFKKCLSP